MFQFLIPFLFGSILFVIGAEIKGSKWESEIVGCINNRSDNDWKNAFDQAVKVGDVEGTSLLAKYCVKDPKDLEKPLFDIARRRSYTKNVLIVKILIDSGVNVNARNWGDTPLHAIVHRWGFDIAKILIENGADVNARNEHKFTPLHIACMFGTPDIIKLLIVNGADVNARNQHRKTPLHFTASFKDTDAFARAIIENANNTDLEARDSDMNTPLKIALYHYSPKVAKFFVESGADISEIDENGNDLLRHIISERHLNRYNIIVIKALIDRGMDVNSRNSDGDTCLHLCDEFWGGKDVADMLIRNGADINAKNKNGTLPQYYFNGHELKILIFFADLKNDATKAINQSGIDVNAIDDEKRTALYWAVYWNQTDAVRILIENGADVNDTDNGENKPIIEAAYRGNAVICKYLVENGADVNSSNKWRATPLHFAARDSNAYVCKVLIELGADVNIKGFYQRTPLHVAVSRGDIDVVRVLIEMGADLDAKTRSGMTPFDIAENFGWEEIAAILKEAKGRQKPNGHCPLDKNTE